ncbi:AbrB family transcriptional regulator [Thermococcus guaymasensis DSM 11113]|uniref:AbrB family transcriptional regulator n=1 Tax=Thermococcus guaymasensis DSM 11113 TaxID=1432656 RepID=A0A0X1KI52_9EURY|nr:AbrB family transcriptional regulator [Thermococcus guaymasensis DSM 11113]
MEPLAKYPTKVMVQGRITLLSTIREYYNIDLGDFIELIVRKYCPDDVLRGHFLARVYDKGYMTIPKGLRDELGIQKGDFVEVLIIDIIKPGDLLGEKAKLLSGVLKGKYELLTPEKESVLMEGVQ